MSSFWGPLQRLQLALKEARELHVKVVSVLKQFGVRNLVKILEDFREAVGAQERALASGSYFVSSTKVPKRPEGTLPSHVRFPLEFVIDSQELMDTVVSSKKTLGDRAVAKLLMAGLESRYGRTGWARNFKEHQPCEVLLTEAHLTVQRRFDIYGIGENAYGVASGINIQIDSQGLTVNGHPAANVTDIYALISESESTGTYSQIQIF